MSVLQSASRFVLVVTALLAYQPAWTIAQPANLAKSEVDALSGAGRWLDLRRLIDGSKAVGDDVNPRYLRGLATFNLLDAAGAIEDLKAGVALAKTSPSAWTYLGRAYRGSGRYTEAEAAYKQALEVRPDFGPGLAYLWELYDLQGRDAEAAAIRSKVGSVDSPSMRWIAGLTKGSEQWPANSKPARPQTTSSPPSLIEPETAKTISMGVALMEQGESKAALELLEPLIPRLEKQFGRFHPATVWATNTAILAAAEQMHMDKAAGLLSYGSSHDQIVLTARDNLARRIQAYGENSERAAIAQLALSYAEYENGNINEAMADAVGCRNKVQRLATPNPKLALWSDVVFSLVLARRGQPEEAVALAKEATAKAFALVGKDDFLPYVALQSLAYNYQSNGQMREALQNIEAALEGFRRVLPPAHRTIIGTLATLLPILASTGQVAKAETLFDQTVRDVRTRYGPDSPEESAVMMQRAYALMAAGRFNDAIPTLRDQYNKAQNLWGVDTWATLETRISLFYSYGAGGQAGAAQRVFREIAPVIEREVRKGSVSDRAAVRQYRGISGIYKFYAVGTLYRDAADAFKYGELSKARTLLEASALSSATKKGLLPPDEQSRFDTLNGLLAANDASLTGAATDRTLRDHYEAERQGLERDLRDLLARLKTTYPKFREATEIAPMEAKAGMDLLDEDTAFLSYFVSGNAVFGFALSKQTGLEAAWLGNIDKLEEKVGTIRDGLSPENMDERGFNYKARDLAEISNKLLTSFAKTLKGKKRLIISPDGPLAFLPFDVLTSNGKLLIEQYDGRPCRSTV